MAYIVVGIDGSATSQKAFHEAVRQAGWRDASVLALHVVHFPYFVGYESAVVDLGTLQTGGKDFLARELDTLAESYGGEFPVRVESKLAVGHCGLELVAAAEPKDGGEPAELVVLGSRGYGGFRGLVLGSVSTYAVHHLTTPLLVIPPDGE